MAVLALDTSTTLQSVAVASSGSILSQESMEGSGRHSETLLPAVQRVLDAASMSVTGLQAVAVTSGPGSFTGLRVGLSTAKGLAVAVGIPVAGFSSLRVLAEALAARSGCPGGATVCALMEAGRGQLYRGLFRAGRGPASPWQLEPWGEESLVSPEACLAGLGEGAVAGGQGLAGRLDAPGTSAPPGLLLVEEMLSLAPVLARQASWLMSRGEFPAEPLEPNYIRAPDALLKRGRRR